MTRAIEVPSPFRCPKCSKYPEISNQSPDSVEFNCECSLDAHGGTLTFLINYQKINENIEVKEISLFLDFKKSGSYIRYEWVRELGWEVQVESQEGYGDIQTVGEGLNFLTPDEAWNLLLRFERLLVFS